MPTTNARRAASLLALSLALVTPNCLPAQEREAEPRILLSLTTTLHEIVWKVHNLLPVEVDPDLPDVEDGDQLELVFTSDGRLKLAAGKPGPELLRLHARPVPLKKVLKQEAGVIFRVMRALAFTQFVMGMHAEPRYVARAMKAVTDFPNQVETLDIVMKPRADFSSGYQIDAMIEPRNGSWLARVVAGVEKSELGAHLMRTPSAAMSVAAAVDGPGLAAMIEPFGEMLASLRGRSKAERAVFRKFARERASAFDGSFSLLIDGPGRYVRLVGLRDPKAFAERAAADIGIAFDTRRVGRAAIEVDANVPGALENSPMKWMKKEEDFFEVVTEEAASELATFSGIVRDFSVKVRWPSDGAEVAKLVERIEKQRLRRLPLLRDALLVAEFNFGDRRLRKTPRSKLLDDTLLEQLGADMIESMVENFPDQIALGIYKRKGNLHLQVFTR
jgi:hypothetical protein